MNQEELEQTYLIRWATMLSGKHPELELLHHIPNGGLRSKSEAKRLKGAGVKPGVPDLCLPVAKQKKNGLYIEMKAPAIDQGDKKTAKGRLSKEQVIWLDRLNAQGYHATVCYGWVEAAEVIIDYLGLNIEV